MTSIQGQSRKQMVLIPDSLDALIGIDNEVRVIDLFVDTLKLSDYQFTIKESTEGRQAYHPKISIKIKFVWMNLIIISVLIF